MPAAIERLRQGAIGLPDMPVRLILASGSMTGTTIGGK